jgi:heat shock protein HslJ
MTRRIARAGVILAAALLVSACAGPTVTAQTAPTALPGTSWMLGVQGGTAPAARDLPTLVFGTDGSVTGFTGCQPYTGTFVASGSSVAVAGLTKTPTTATCAPSVVTAGDAFLAALGTVTAWRTEVVPPASGVTVLAPVKLLLDGPTPLVLTLQ